MFCRHCGNEMKDKAVVCSSCGNPVAEGIDFEPPTAPRWSWFTMFITIGIIALLLLIAIIAGL
jgi:predicted amidophosphoribosyltransferase